MKKKMISGFVVLLCLMGVRALGMGEQESHPLSKEEILLMLKQVRERQITQGEIAAQVDRRGVAFSVDERVFDELRRAGARSFLIDAIRRAGRAPVRLESAPDAAGADASADATGRTGGDEDPLDQRSLLRRARQQALEFIEELPNFIVTQVVTRYVRTSRDENWKRRDTLEVKLTYRRQGGETFNLIRVNGRPTRRSYEELGGATSTGELASILAAAFSPASRAEFREVGRESFRGRPAVIYDFKVRTEHSIGYIRDLGTGRSVRAGYSGSIWIGQETGRVLRIEQSHDDIPPGFPITLAENAIEYDWVTIAGERYFLPVRAEVIMGRDHLRYYNRNVIEFEDYRKFESGLEVILDDDRPK